MYIKKLSNYNILLHIVIIKDFLWSLFNKVHWYGLRFFKLKFSAPKN